VGLRKLKDGTAGDPVEALSCGVLFTERSGENTRKGRKAGRGASGVGSLFTNEGKGARGSGRYVTSVILRTGGRCERGCKRRGEGP